MKHVWPAILILPMLLAPMTFVAGQARGVNVVVRNENGSTQEVRLYDGSYALIIGESDYTNGWKSLPGVKSDVKAVSAALTANGFAVTELLNATRAQLVAGIDDFIKNYGYGPGNRLLIYYAGHGYTQKSQDGRELGYIVPSDAPLPNENDLLFRQTALNMNEIENYAKRIEAKHALFVFDSCFSGTLLTRRRSSVPPIITQKTTQAVRQFITAGADDQEVPDVSVFRQQFVEGLNGEADSNKDGYVTGSEFADFLQTKVTNYTRGSQTPQYGKIFDPLLDKGDFVFVVGKAAPVTPVADKGPVEQEFWNTIKESRKAGDFELYLKEYPQGKFAALARLKISQLGGSTEAVIEPGTVRNNSLGIEFAYVPPGSFRMGLDDGYKWEKPVHLVTIKSGFWMGRTEVTQGQWRQVMGTTPKQQRDLDYPSDRPVENGLGDNYPMFYVSWDDAQAFIRKLNEKNDGFDYSLPTEAEWEYACRAGTTGDFSGTGIADEMGWSNENSEEKLHPVAQKRPNAYGLFDMHGNVFEWCLDLFNDEGYDGVPSDGSANITIGDKRLRALRGGSVMLSAKEIRSGSRSGNLKEQRSANEGHFGFRILARLK